MPAGYTTVSASYLQDATGTLIASATIFFLPVSNNSNRLSFRAGGAQGQAVAEEVSATVTDGVFSITLADPNLTSPKFIGYRVRLRDNVTGRCLPMIGYECVQWPSGTAFNFDTYIPDLQDQVTVQYGPQGPPGAAGGGSMVPGTVAGTIDGNNVTFTLTPNGYTVTETITLTTPPQPASAANGNVPDRLSADVLITTPESGSPSIAYQVIYLNRLRLEPGVDYSVS